MRTSYVFLCAEQPEGQFARQRFLRATRGSLVLFPTGRSSYGILELSLLGSFGIMVCLFFFLRFLAPSSFNAYFLLSPVFVLWAFKAWPWAIQVAFNYSGRRSPIGLGLSVQEVRFGILNHKLRVETEGKQTMLIVYSRRGTLANALELAALAN